MLTCSHRSVGLKMLRAVCEAIPTQQALVNFSSSGTFTYPSEESMLLLGPSIHKQISTQAVTTSICKPICQMLPCMKETFDSYSLHQNVFHQPDSHDFNQTFHLRM